MRKIGLILLILLLGHISSFATHIFGGDLSYIHLGNNSYQITLIVYRDCGPSNTNGTGFDANAAIGIYNAGGGIFQTVSVPLNNANVSLVPITLNDPCLSVPVDLCVEKAIYQTTVTLPFSASGYVISYQRCCRNNSIDNITNPANSGITLTATVPGTNAVSVQNSSPLFNAQPPVALCLGSSFVYDAAATDVDGDSLVYSFCDPYLGGTSTAPTPNPPTAPPYNAVTWAAGYSTDYPIASGPAMTVDPQSGVMSGVANQLGTYAIALCVAEYRNGVLINTIRRDYQFNVVLCDPTTTAAIGLPSNQSNCVGAVVNFTNNSVNATNYHWDFGVSGSDADTSNLFQPSFTYENPGTYTITLITNPGLDCADTTTLTYSAFPVPSTMPSSLDPVCVGADVQLQTSTFPGVTYQWFGPANFFSGQQNPILNNVAVNQSGTYYVTANFSGCSSPIASVVLTVNSTPNAQPTSGGAACIGGNIQLIGNTLSNATYSWAGPLNFISSEQSPLLSGVSANTEGFYSLQVTSNGCVSEWDSVYVDVLAEPSTQASYNGPLCNGDSLILSCDLISGASYQWSGPNGFSSSEPSPVIVNANNGIAGQYSVVVISASCPSLASSTNVVVNEIPFAQASISNTSFCVGDNLAINANVLPGASYEWFGPNGFTSGQASVFIDNVQLEQEGAYEVIVSQNGCSSSPAGVSFEVFPIPTGLINQNSPVCEGELLSLTAINNTGSNSNVCDAAGNLVIYSNYDGGILNINVDENIPNLKVGICTYEPIQVNFSGPFVGNITEVVYAGFNSTQNNNNCGQGNFVTAITGVNPGIVSIQTAPQVGYTPAHGNGAGPWGGIMIGSNGQCDTLQSAGGVNTPDEIVYYFENALNANLYFHWSQYACWLNEIKSLSEHGNCCITYQNASNANYTWNIPGAGQQNGETWSTGAATLNNDGTVTLTIEQDGCVSSLITAEVQVNPIPNVTIQQVDDYCEGETVILDAMASVGGSSFVWTGPGGFISNADPVVLNNAQVSQSGNYTAVATAAGCESDPLNLILAVHPLPEVDIVVADNSVCLGQSITMNVTGVVSAVWNGSYNGLSFDFLGNSSDEITVVGTDEFGCSNATSENMIVHLPSINIFQAAPAHPELEGYLGGYYPLLTQFMANGNAESFLWEFGDTTSSLFTTMPDTIYHIYENPGQFMLLAIAEIDGCFAYDTVWIETFAESLLGCDAGIEHCIEGEIPSVVTPNGDGDNDYFWIPNRFMQEWEVKIFNRWGTLLFTIDTPHEERMIPVQYWDPKEVNGGVYYYTYRGKGVDYIDYQGQGYFQVVK